MKRFLFVCGSGPVQCWEKMGGRSVQKRGRNRERERERERGSLEGVEGRGFFVGWDVGGRGVGKVVCYKNQ